MVVKQTTKISVVIPVFNEAQSLSQLHQNLTKALAKLKHKWEIIYIDDGSTDRSFLVLKKLAKKNKNTTLIKLKKNFGKGIALKTGFEQANGQFIFTLDADLQDDPQEISKLLNQLKKGVDVAVGWKTERQDPFEKKLVSYVFNMIASWMMGFRLHDINCGLKGYQKNVLKNIQVRGDLFRFIPLLAHTMGCQVVEIRVKHFPRKYGRSKYRLTKIFGGLVDLITVLFLTKFNQKPAHFFGSLGLVFLCLGLTADGYVTILKIFTGTIQNHLPLLIFGVLAIIVGIQLVSLGLLSELIAQGQKSYADPIDKILP